MSGLRNADPRPGERVAVLGLGGLGHLALQLSHAVGLETWAVTGQAGKSADLKAMGAHEVVVGGADPGKALRAAGGFDVILSTTNSAKQIASAFGALRPGGRLVNMGVADGPIESADLSPVRPAAGRERGVVRRVPRARASRGRTRTSASRTCSAPVLLCLSVLVNAEMPSWPGARFVDQLPPASLHSTDTFRTPI